MRLLGKSIGFVQRATVTIGVVFLLLITVLMFVTVVLRYFVGSAVPYTMVFLTGLMVWFVFLALGSVSRRDEHIKISILADMLFRGRAKEILATLENVVALPLCIYFTWAGYQWVTLTMAQGTRYLFGYFYSYPAWIPHLILPIGFGIASLFYLERTVKQVQSILLRRGEGQYVETEVDEKRTGDLD